MDEETKRIISGVPVDELMQFFGNEIKAGLSARFGDGVVGFALIVFPFNTEIRQGGGGHYISNAERSNMIDALRETADRLEKNETMGPAVGSA